jgi:hypothetical protein
MAPTPLRWWTTIPDKQRPAWRAAAQTGVLPTDLAAELDKTGLIPARYNDTAYMPPPLAEETLAP